jgi:hypothetical protein
MSGIKKAVVATLSSDKILGLFGGGLAAASLGFGVYMNVHGPVASFGHSGDFPLFAQIAGSQTSGATRMSSGPAPGEPLDMEATASIQHVSQTVIDAARRSGAVLSSIQLQAASSDAATIVVDGQTRTIRVGDTVPAAGEVLEIRAEPAPLVRTTRGFILSAQDGLP